MRIFVLGNINAGKSYVVEKLRKKLPNYTVLQIDEWRRNNCDGSIEKEEQAWINFPKAILEEQNVIAELSGGGRIAQNIIDGLPNRSCLVFKVCASKEECLLRMKDKDFSSIPYPKYDGAETIDETIVRIDQQMSQGSIERLWGEKSIDILSINSFDDVSHIPIKQYEKIDKITELYRHQPCQMFLFGSAGRGKMTENSDVDIFLYSNKSVEWHCQYVRDYFESASVMGNEVVVREEGILIELDVINDLSKAEHFYRTGNIEDPRKTILIGDNVLLETLTEFLSKKYDLEEDLRYIVERLKYYVLSLPSLQQKNDEYKYYFHNNIIVHEYVRLRAMLSGIFEHNYLPLQAKKLLTEKEWNTLLYSFGDDMGEHYVKTKEMCDSLIDIVKKTWNI